MQDQKQKEQASSALSTTDAYKDPPTIFDSMRKEKADPDKVNPLGSGTVGFFAVLLIVVALIAGAIGLNSDPSAPREAVRTIFNLCLRTAPPHSGKRWGLARLHDRSRPELSCATSCEFAGARARGLVQQPM